MNKSILPILAACVFASGFWLLLKPDQIDSETFGANQVGIAALSDRRVPGADRLSELFGKPRSIGRDQEIENLLVSWGRKDALAGIAAVERLQLPVADTVGYTDAVLAGWAAVQPEKAWSWAMESLARLPRRNTTPGETLFGFGPTRLKTVATAMLGARKYELAAELVGSGANEPNSLVIQPVAAAWAAENPGAALKWLAQLPVGLTRLNATLGVAGGLAQKAPGQAAEFLSSRPSPVEKSMAGVGAISGLSVRGDADVAWAWLYANCSANESGVFDRAYLAYFSSPAFAHSYPPAAKSGAAIGRIKDPSLRSRAAYAYVAGMGDKAPEDALRIGVRFLAGEKQTTELCGLVSRWSGRNPSAAARFVGDMEDLDSGLRNSLLGSVARADGP